VSDITVRRVEELEGDEIVLWHASVSEHDISEVIEVHVDAAVDSAEDYDVEEVVRFRVEHELDEIEDTPERLGELRERGPLEVTVDELDRWSGTGRGR
jgi:hypothetical protein